VRQQSNSAYPLNSLDLGRTIGPYETFEHDVLIAGCVDLDADKDADSGEGKTGAEIESGQVSGTTPADTEQDANAEETSA